MTAVAKPESFGDLGEAMRQLNERQRAFVRAYVIHPPGNGALVNSYIAAGYGTPESNRATLAKNAHHLSRDPKIIAAVREEAQALLRLGHPEAVNVLYEVMRDGNHKDRVRAAAAILDRADPLQTAHRIDVVHKQISPEDEMLEEYRAMLKLGVTHEKLREVFGGNTLPRLERRLAEEARVIDGKVINDSNS